MCAIGSQNLALHICHNKSLPRGYLFPRPPPSPQKKEEPSRGGYLCHGFWANSLFAISATVQFVVRRRGHIMGHKMEVIQGPWTLDLSVGHFPSGWTVSNGIRFPHVGCVTLYALVPKRTRIQGTGHLRGGCICRCDSRT